MYEIREGHTYDVSLHCCVEAFYVMRKRSISEIVFMHLFSFLTFGVVPLVEMKQGRLCHYDFSDINWQEDSCFLSRKAAENYIANLCSVLPLQV